MGDILFAMMVGFCAYWLGGVFTQADLAHECLTKQSIKLDGNPFTCELVRKKNEQS